MYKWEDLMELSKKTVEEAKKWLEEHEIEGEWEIEDDWARFDEDGYWADSHLVIEFEDNRVARWYRSEDWD